MLCASRVSRWAVSSLLANSSDKEKLMALNFALSEKRDGTCRLLRMNAREELPGHICETWWTSGPIFLIVSGISACCPFMAKVCDEVRDDWYSVLTAAPGKAHATLRLFCHLGVTSIEVSPGHPVAMRRSCKVRTIGFKPGELLVVVAVDVEDRYGTGQLRRRVHQRCGNSHNAANLAGMAGCEKLRHSGATREAGKEDPLTIGMVAAQNVTKDSREVSVIVHRPAAGWEEMSARALHLPECDIALSVGWLIGSGSDGLRKDGKEAAAICLLHPAKVFCVRSGSTTDAAQHEDGCRMRNRMRWPEDEIGAKISVVCEWADIKLSDRGWYGSKDQRDEKKRQTGCCGEEPAFLDCMVI